MATMKILGEREGDDRNTILHKKIVQMDRIPNTQAGWHVVLECGHAADVFGNIERAAGRLICMSCAEARAERAECN